MNTLKEPVTKCHPVVSVTPPRISKQLAHPPKGLSLSAVDANRLSNTAPLYPTLKQAYRNLPTASTNTLSGAIIPSRRNCGTRALLLQPPSSSTQKRRQIATSSNAHTSRAVSNEPNASQQPPSDCGDQIFDSTATVKIEDLPVYSYRRWQPQATRYYIRSEKEANNALKSVVGPTGFDLEWWVPYRKEARPVAVVQLATCKAIYIIQISSMKKAFPRKLKEILEDSTIIKAGVNVRGDARKLYADFKVKIQNLVELSWLSRMSCEGKEVPSSRRLISLHKLTALYLGRQLLKDKVRISNWERELNEKQLEYAANDAHCSLSLYNHFISVSQEHKRTLVPRNFTLSLTLAGEVVAGAETPLYEKPEPENEALVERVSGHMEKGTTRPAFSPSKPFANSQAPNLSCSTEDGIYSTIDSASKPTPPQLSWWPASCSISDPTNTVLKPNKLDLGSPIDNLMPAVSDSHSLHSIQEGGEITHMSGRDPSALGFLRSRHSKGAHMLEVSTERVAVESLIPRSPRPPPDIVEISDSDFDDTNEELRDLASKFAEVDLSEPWWRSFSPVTDAHDRLPTTTTRSQLTTPTDSTKIVKQAKVDDKSSSTRDTSLRNLSRTTRFAPSLQK